MNKLFDSMTGLELVTSDQQFNMMVKDHVESCGMIFVCECCQQEVEIEPNGFCHTCNQTKSVMDYMSYDMQYTSDDAVGEGRQDKFTGFQDWLKQQD